ncbi:CopG family ribbon-helix-helix protein [Nitrincola schmidtii]|uniref:CopG family ribbon-helix-helix protein n=1 Tax=Nitrincola schmidtii TaxID=1730894 RepID=UPI00124D4C2F|nr:ribbon-helix-helix domain-containing protein [Nitrincola schmidtii]
MHKSSTRVMTAHLPVALAEKVDEVASKLDRSKGWIVKQALTDWLAQEELRDQLTYEALSDVDQGLTFEHQEINDWIESLDTEHPLSQPKK